LADSLCRLIKRACMLQPATAQLTKSIDFDFLFFSFPDDDDAEEKPTPMRSARGGGRMRTARRIACACNARTYAHVMLQLAPPTASLPASIVCSQLIHDGVSSIFFHATWNQRTSSPAHALGFFFFFFSRLVP
jgi:hypothetical protein